MGSKKRAPAAKPHDHDQDQDKDKEEEEEEVSEELPPKIENGDLIAMRNLLGDKLTEYFQHNDYRVDFSWDNRKLISMAIACCFGVLSHFNGQEFPDNLWIVLGCVFTFGAINCSIIAFDVYVQDDITTTVHTKQRGGPSDKFYCRGKYERYSEHYTVGLEYVHDTDKRKVQEDIYIGKLFDSEGYFDQHSLFQTMDRLVQRFEKKKSD